MVPLAALSLGMLTLLSTLFLAYSNKHIPEGVVHSSMCNDGMYAMKMRYIILCNDCICLTP
jgi:hypothetical protein